MPQFKPFSLGDSIQAGQAMKMNQLKIQLAERQMARTEKLRGLAQMSKAPVYGEYQQPESQTFPGEAPIQGLKQKTDEQFSPEVYQKNLAQEGFVDESLAMQDQIAKMDESQRKEAEFRAERIGRLLFSAKGNPEAWDQGIQEAIDNGWLTPDKAVPYSDQAWQKAMDNTQKVSDLLKSYEDKTPYAKINPKDYTSESLEVYERTGKVSDLEPIGNENIGGSEFERNLDELEGNKKITPEEKLAYIRKRVGVLSGAEQTEHQEITTGMRAAKEKARQTTALSNEATKGIEHFSNMNTSINGALAAIKSGDTKLSDILLTQVLSQVQDSKVRAFQMYKEFDTSFGNVAERTIRGVLRFIGGARTEEEKAQIAETLNNFREAHVSPGLNKLKNMYRDMARGRKLDPFDVVPPRSPEEIRDYPGMLKKDKVKYLKLYFPEKFQ